MTVASVAPRRTAPQLLIWSAPDSDIARLIDEVDALAQRKPAILTMIERDLDARGLAKKRLRVADRRWREARNARLPGLGDEDDGADATALCDGRPRMPAILVLVFVVLRGYLGGFKDRKVQSQLADSMALAVFLRSHGYELPGASTLVDNTNAVSDAVLTYVMDLQIQRAKDEGLDDFEEVTCDSTAVAANSRWPSDSGTITTLLRRAEHNLTWLREHGVTVRWREVVGSLVGTAEGIHKQIQLTTGKKNGARRRKTLYRRLFKLAKTLAVDLQGALARADAAARKIDDLPTATLARSSRLEAVEVDLRNLALSIENAEARVNAGRKVEVERKILSTSDDDAAMIVKGQREPTLGYRPQVARSKSGFVTAIVVPTGNAADSGQIEAIADAAIVRTGVVPRVLSFDDGYTNTQARRRYRARGVETVSFSGSKGKNVIPREDYDSAAYKQARNDRSAVESSIFVLKHNFDFDDLMRRGIAAVRAELEEKVIAHNFFRLIALRSALNERTAAA